MEWSRVNRATIKPLMYCRAMPAAENSSITCQGPDQLLDPPPQRDELR